MKKPEKSIEQFEVLLLRRAVQITLQRSRARKSTMLAVHKDGRVILKAPIRVSMPELQRFVASKAEWIINGIQKAEATRQKYAHRENTIRFLGAEYAVQIEKSVLLRKHGFCELDENILHVHVPAKLTPAKEKAAIVHAIKTWYQKMAADIFAERTALYAAKLGVQVKAIKLADPKSRWGSCGTDGKLMFSWRVMMCAIEIVDYLIVHELCHLVHFDHSKAYWQTVEKILPDYKTRRAQLRDAESDLKIGNPLAT